MRVWRKLNILVMFMAVFALNISARTLSSDDSSISLMADSCLIDDGIVSDDSVAAEELPPLRGKNWLDRLINSGFHINDPRIRYPKFAQFCVNVYNWGDRTFNSYDPDYVVGTGKNWKVIGKSYNWAQSYMLTFTKSTSIRMISDLYSDVGAHLCFMAVSVGYDFNANELVGNPVSNRTNFEFNFTCALFAANYQRSSTKGGAHVTKFGKFKPSQGQSLDFNFDGVNQESTVWDLYYFFNHRKYSQAAAYCYSKYQLKSAGSMIAGFNYTHQEISLDFSQLPADMLAYLPGDHDYYNFRYTDYDLMVGYAYNCVMKPRKWLFNVTVLPSIGYKHSYEDSTEGRKDMFSTNVKMMLSFVYNHRSLFSSLSVRFDGRAYYGNGYTFFNSNESLTFNIGARF